jgi:hypothetical protein
MKRRYFSPLCDGASPQREGESDRVVKLNEAVRQGRGYGLGVRIRIIGFSVSPEWLCCSLRYRRWRFVAQSRSHCQRRPDSERVTVTHICHPPTIPVSRNHRRPSHPPPPATARTETENLMLSLVHEMMTVSPARRHDAVVDLGQWPGGLVSPMVLKSRTMRWNSADGLSGA